MIKSHQVKPAVDNILRAGYVEVQADLLRAVDDHTSLSTVWELVRINSPKEQMA